MTSFIRIIVVTLIAFAGCRLHCYAQADTTDIDDFMPRDRVIFYDDFEKDKAGAFPALWYIQPVNGKPYTSVRLCHVNKDGEQAMVIQADKGADAATNDNLIEPRMKDADYLPDSFTLQYDFFPGSEAAVPTLYFRTATPVRIPFMIYSKDSTGWTIEATVNSVSRKSEIRFEFKEQKWHHFALSFYKHKLVCYLDDEIVLTMQNCGFDPTGFILSATKEGSISYANVRVATGVYLMGDHYNFGKLFLADKFTTHSIHFDVKQSTIQPGSTEFIKKLAGWLKQNPTVRLEINGHTDNDGKDADNMKLSQDRADEVKKQLVAYGINALRITTKGFGASKPVQPNSTLEGKAYNRRVEFIKH